MLYVGVDAHKVKSHLTVMDEAGRVIARKRVSSSPDALRETLGHYDEPMKAVLEAGYSWGPIFDWLGDIADEVVLAHPLKLRAIADARIKTDRIDSETLAHLLRADLIPPAYAPSKETRACKRVLRQRMFLVRIGTMFKNRIRALLSQHAITLPDVSDLYGRAGLEWLGNLNLPDPDGHLLTSDLALLQAVKDHIASTEALVKELTAEDPAIHWLRSVPGIGSFLAVLIRYEIDTIDRFTTAKRFVSHTGLVPSTYASGQRLTHGRITKHGNKWLRWAYIEAVTPAIRCSATLRTHYEGIKARRGAKDARTSTARKIAELTWIVWTQCRCYEER
ncbi:MAG TPA: IS110 family transposase [bacterium]|nr:IS110 family transposase [bacterium]